MMRMMTSLGAVALISIALTGCQQTSGGYLESRAVLEGPVGYDRAVVTQPAYVSPPASRYDRYERQRDNSYGSDRRYDDRTTYDRDPYYDRRTYGRGY